MKFKVPIYEVMVNIIVVPNKFETTKYYLKLIKKFKMPSEGEEPCEGFVLFQGFSAYIVFAKDKLDISLICHEVSHLTFKILNLNNVEEGKDNEQFALLNGFLNKTIINKLGCKIIMT